MPLTSKRSMSRAGSILENYWNSGHHPRADWYVVNETDVLQSGAFFCHSSHDDEDLLGTLHDMKH